MICMRAIEDVAVVRWRLHRLMEQSVVSLDFEEGALELLGTLSLVGRATTSKRSQENRQLPKTSFMVIEDSPRCEVLYHVEVSCK